MWDNVLPKMLGTINTLSVNADFRQKSKEYHSLKSGIKHGAVLMNGLASDKCPPYIKCACLYLSLIYQ